MKHLLCVLFVGALSIAQAQIESGKKSKKPAKKSLADTSVLVYLQGGIGTSFRKLEANNTSFGKDPGERVNESSLGVKNMQIGILSPVNKFMKWDLGLNWITYGEQYSRVSGDTTFSYTNRYSSAGIPIRVQLEYGNAFRVFCSTGFQTQLLSRYRHEETTDIRGNKTELVDKAEPTLNTINLASCSSLGIRIRFMNRLQILAAADYYVQISNSYTKQGAYRHLPWVFSGRFALLYQL